MQLSPNARTAEDLSRQVEDQQASLHRLERMVDAIADNVGIGFAGRCSNCEDGILLWSDGALVCSDCSFVQRV